MNSHGSDADKLWALVTTVMKKGFHNIRGISILSEELLASKEGLLSHAVSQ
jgi:hypothetical protein